MSERSLGDLIDDAFHYRGFVTLSRRDGTRSVGYVYDRSRSHVEMFDERAASRVRVAVEDIVEVELTGEDSAARAQEQWARRKVALELPARFLPDEGRSPTLFLVALPHERRAVARAVREDGGIVHVLGVGGGGAAHAIEAERPALVVSCGFAGALDPVLATGSVVLATSVRDELGERWLAAEPVLRRARRALEAWPYDEGELVSTTEIASSARKHELARAGRLAVDLESAAVVRAACRAGVPWLAVRVVLDPLDLELPAFAQEIRAHYVAAAVRHALRGPRAVRELASLALRAGTAAAALRQIAARLAPVLAASEEPAA